LIDPPVPTQNTIAAALTILASEIEGHERRAMVTDIGIMG